MVFPFLDRFQKNGLVPLTHRKAIPVGCKRPETLAEQVARLVRNSNFAASVHAQGLETFEEADDFDVEDEIPLPNTPWETNFDYASANAMDRGVVQSPSPEQLASARTLATKVRETLSSKQKKAPTVPQQGTSTAKPINSAEGEVPPSA